jgi:hypothetical protein
MSVTSFIQFIKMPHLQCLKPGNRLLNLWIIIDPAHHKIHLGGTI